KDKMISLFLRRFLKRGRKNSIIITLLFFTIATLVPSYAHATESNPSLGTTGLQMTFNSEGTSYQIFNSKF
ncbi:hypothetical protein V7111_18070, partial [Neobacillus niacini]|uniref:hypothetical protein n=1 Tax=Neobacillus niacini TaxID=86668 RepID=UPI0030020C78